MPSLEHESIAALFRNRPSLAGELLHDVLGIAVPEYDKARVESGDLTEWNPAEYRADVVTVYESGSPVMGVIVEVQRGRDPDKRWSWPAYVAGLRARMRCPTLLLVICPDRAVGRWCSQPIDLGHPGLTLTPLVVPPERIPVVTDEREAATAPELAVLSAMAHGTGAQRQRIFRALLSAVGAMGDDDQADLYIDIVLRALSDASARELEDMMASGTYPYKSDFARRHFARGEAEGEAKGEARGEARGEAKAILRVLSARGLCVPDDVRDRVIGCTDIARLERWLDRAVVAETADDIFRDV